MKINREELLKKLQLVSPGVSQREVVEQSTCFVFAGKRVATCNDEVACSIPCEIGIEGAVQSSLLLELLSKMKDSDIDLSTNNGELIVQAKRKRSGLVLESEVKLPIEAIKPPKQGWIPLNGDFDGKLQSACRCAGTDNSLEVATWIHLSPGKIEAFDNFQAIRCSADSELPECFIRAESAKQLVGVGAEKMALGDSWAHFRNGQGLLFSCRKYMGDWPDLTPIFKCTGTQLTLPVSLTEAVSRAGLFSADGEQSRVTIDLKPGKVKIKGRGAQGWHEELAKCQYDGPLLQFQIDPLIFMKIVTEYEHCIIGEERLKVEGDGFTFVAATVKVE